MKKIQPALILPAVGLLITALIFSGCMIFGAGDDEPDFELTSYPDTQEKALSLFLDVDDALYAAFLNNATGEEDSLTWTGSFEGGSVDITGSSSENVIPPDDDVLNEGPNENEYQAFYSAKIAGTFTDVVLTYGSWSYKCTGEINSVSSLDYSIDVTVDNGAYIYDVDYTLNYTFTFSSTVIRSDGTGAKIIISLVTTQLAGSDIEIDVDSDDYFIYDNVIADIQSHNILLTLQVYDEQDNLIDEYSQINLSDLFEDSDFNS